MGTLTCDDCGSIQSERNEKCELCGGSLSEEREQAERRSVLVLFGAAIVTTLLLCVLPGVGLSWWFHHDISSERFWMVYLGAWALGSVLVQFFSPKDSYDFGYRAGPYFIGRPFTLRDNADRAHAQLGLVLFPMGIVSGLWIAVVRRVLRK